MAAVSLRSALLSSSSSPACALRRLSAAPRAYRFAQPKVSGRTNTRSLRFSHGFRSHLRSWSLVGVLQGFGRVRRLYPAAAASAMSTSSGTKEARANNPGLQAEVDPATKGYFMQQTMFRVKDPKVSLDFYSRVMGMSLLKRLDFPEMKFSLFFLGYEDLSAAPADPVQRTGWTFGQKATIELTHNWGTESDPEFKGYHNGNSDPRGFGHIGVTVDDVYKACERFERLGVEFVKKPDDGKMKGIAFIKDPDGYWIEIFDLKRIGEVTATAS